MRRLILFTVALLAAVPMAAQTLPSPPSAFSAFGGVLTVGTKGPPEPTLGYTLAAWPSFLRQIGGQGSIVGMVSKTGYALGVGHSFADYRSSLGTVVLTLGPALYVPFNAAHGLHDGQIRLFVSVSIAPPRGGAP